VRTTARKRRKVFKKILIPIMALGVGVAFTAETAAVSKNKPDLSKGKKIYETSLCITCHGAKGKGDGAAAAALTKKPRNFNDTVYMASEGMVKLRKSIALGGGSVGLSPLMTGFKGALKDKQIDEVLDYILTTFSGKGSAKFDEIVKAAEKPKAEQKK
jgi:mono/diheme cytochrome c family protein